MKDLNVIFQEMEIRRDNVRDAIALGIFGTNSRDITKNLMAYNAEKETQVNHECEEINEYVESELKRMGKTK